MTTQNRNRLTAPPFFRSFLMQLIYMKYNPSLLLPQGWEVNSYTDQDELGNDLSCIEATSSQGQISILVGELPEGETAEDEAFANYVEMIGFDQEDEGEDTAEEVIQSFMFNSRKAYGFSAFDEDDNVMSVFCQEARKGICVLFVVTSNNDSDINSLMSLVEKGFRL